jgi:transmembrane protein TMEM260 (protein O-mannosyltransferase)
LEFLHDRLHYLGLGGAREALMVSSQGRRPARADWLHAALVAASLFALYAATSPRSVALEDDGLFVLSSYFLGIEHPPGYPLFTILGKLATLVPIGSVAYRVHLLSALFGALSCAALWLCARQLLQKGWTAYLAAFGLGLSRTFWSQAIIAEVYTFNTFFLFALVYLILRATSASGAGRAALIAIALVFGLSLANHWPLMLLAAPGLAVLLWPRNKDVARNLVLLGGCFLLGLSPYVWLVLRSWDPLPISFYGPLESWHEVAFMLSRAGYSTVDVSQTSTWLDRTKFFAFFGTELALQFAVVGTVLAALGFAVQWTAWSKTVCWGLTLAFLGPSALLLCLLGFDYDAIHKHIFHVYPLPAYGIAALWMALGAEWLARRARPRPGVQGAACALVVGAIFATGWHWNTKSGIEWTIAYARALLESVPRDAILIVRGDSDLTPLAYFHMIEGWRPDLTLVQPSGLILGNRWLHPLRTSGEDMKELVIRRVGAEHGIVVSTLFSEIYLGDQPRRDAWLFQVVDRSAGNARKVIDIPLPLVDFFERAVLDQHPGQPWLANLQGELTQKYARLLAMQSTRGGALEPRAKRQWQALAEDFHGALGLVEGLLSREGGYDTAQAVALLEQVRLRMPSDAGKREQARYFELRAYLRQGQGDARGALEDFQTSITLWPVKENGAIAPLTDLYQAAGDLAALSAMQARLKR